MSRDLVVDRLERERAFHDDRFSEETRAATDKYYVAAGSSDEDYHRALEVEPGTRVLEYGCGTGSAAPALAARGARVVGIDLSGVAVAQAQSDADDDGSRFIQMNAEELAFGDGFFDVVCGSGILHHLDLDRAFAEVRRVLRPGGQAVFVEPLGHNPLINAYRRATPNLRTDDEHPLLMGDIDRARRYFTSVDVSHHALFSLATAPLSGTLLGRRAVPRVNALDQWIFRSVPALRRYSWIVVLRFSA
ncbi:MAG: class I SAM-dependent methyltransferase [Actinomycetia bacterium]|nr:class I SAM-dependent methyltransferase [Actinomycetes bacterium]